LRAKRERLGRDHATLAARPKGRPAQHSPHTVKRSWRALRGASTPAAYRSARHEPQGLAATRVPSQATAEGAHYLAAASSWALIGEICISFAPHTVPPERRHRRPII